MPDLHQDTTMKKETGKANPDHNLIFKNIAAQVITIHTESNQGHNTGTDAATTGAAHDNHTLPIEVTDINLSATHHINLTTDHTHIEVLQLFTPEITVGHTHDHPTDLQGRTHTDQVHIPANHEENHTSRRTQGSKLRIHTWTVTALMITPVTQERNPIIKTN